MANIYLLKEKIKSADIEVDDLAQKIGIDRSTFYRKLAKEGSTFSLAEADKMKSILNLNREDAMLIFFDN